MNQEELIESFLKFEHEKKMFDAKINGIRFWHYIRFRIYNDLIRIFEIGNVLLNVSIKEEKQKESWGDFLYKFVRCNQFMAKERDILIIPHRRKYKDQDGYSRCIYTDLLDQSLGRTHYLLDERSVNGIFEKQRSKNVLYSDWEIFREKKKLKYEYVPIEKKDFDQYVVLPIEKFYGITIEIKDKQNWLKALNSILERRKYLINYYSYMLRKIKPKVIVLTVGYSPNRMILCEVAKKKKIPIVEILHGSIGKMTLPYNFYCKRNFLWFPDYVFTFGMFDKVNVRYPIDSSKVIPVGYPELERHCQKKTKKRYKKKMVLFISQGLVEIAQYAYHVAKSLDEEKYQIIFKLHPKEYGNWRDIYGNCLNHHNIKIVGDFEKTIYTYLAEADWVIGSYSTVMFEATMFETKIIIVKTGLYINAHPLYDNGYALLVDSYDKLINAITEDIFKKKPEISIFEKNSIYNMINEIDKIIEEDNVKI